MVKLYQVPADVFLWFINNHSLTEKAGAIFHSSNFVDSNGVVQAYMETSSWGAGVIYKISDERYQNLETIDLVTKFF